MTYWDLAPGAVHETDEEFARAIGIILPETESDREIKADTKDDNLLTGDLWSHLGDLWNHLHRAA